MNKAHLSWQLLPSFCLLISLSCAPKPTPSYEENTPIDLSYDPENAMIENPEVVEFMQGGFDFKIKLKASYRVRGIVVSRKNYGGD